MDASSDSSTGVKATSGSGTGVHGVSTGSGLAGLFDGDVQVNGAATIAFAESPTSGQEAAVAAYGTSGARGVYASTDSGYGIHGVSTGSGLAGRLTATSR